MSQEKEEDTGKETAGGLFQEREGRDLIWKDLDVTLSADKKDQKDKKILDNVWGEVPAGQVTASRCKRRYQRHPPELFQLGIKKCIRNLIRPVIGPEATVRLQQNVLHAESGGAETDGQQQHGVRKDHHHKLVLLEPARPGKKVVKFKICQEFHLYKCGNLTILKYIYLC